MQYTWRVFIDVYLTLLLTEVQGDHSGSLVSAEARGPLGTDNGCVQQGCLLPSAAENEPAPQYVC